MTEQSHDIISSGVHRMMTCTFTVYLERFELDEELIGTNYAEQVRWMTSTVGIMTANWLREHRLESFTINGQCYDSGSKGIDCAMRDVFRDCFKEWQDDHPECIHDFEADILKEAEQVFIEEIENDERRLLLGEIA